MPSTVPLLLEPDALKDELGVEDLLVVDLCDARLYRRFHVPGATHLEYGMLIQSRPPVGGLLPDPEHLSRVFSALGLKPGMHVVAYDDEGGGKAGRLLWTLHLLGHERCSLLNGGLHAWANEGRAMEESPAAPQPVDYTAAIRDARYLAEWEYIRDRLDDPDVVLLDTRTPAEYCGMQRFAARGGHIPGAVNLDWTQTIDQGRNLRLKPEAELRALFEALDVTPDREVIVYCQTHHRSSHTFVVLKSLGYPRIRGYSGAWSEWGNREDLPAETC